MQQPLTCVPDLGVVQVDETSDPGSPDYIYKLKSIDIVPLPSAALIGTLGIGLVDWMRRRRRL